MSAPTIWEEGRWSPRRVTRFSVSACVLLIAIDRVVSAELGSIFDLGFVAVCATAALAIRPTDFFVVGIMPPLLLLGLFVVLGAADRGSITPADDSLIQSVISGLAHHSGALLVGYGIALAVLAVRSRVQKRRATAGYSNRAVSPAPYRVISGAPEVKSTTVVGNDPHSPESMTASSS